jgi:hypothetical protein
VDVAAVPLAAPVDGAVVVGAAVVGVEVWELFVVAGRVDWEGALE